MALSARNGHLEWSLGLYLTNGRPQSRLEGASQSTQLYERVPGVRTREETNMGSSRLYRLGVSQAQKAKVLGDERPRLVSPTVLFL